MISILTGIPAVLSTCAELPVFREVLWLSSEALFLGGDRRIWLVFGPLVCFLAPGCGVCCAFSRVLGFLGQILHAVRGFLAPFVGFYAFSCVFVRATYRMRAMWCGGVGFVLANALLLAVADAPRLTSSTGFGRNRAGSNFANHPYTRG